MTQFLLKIYYWEKLFLDLPLVPVPKTLWFSGVRQRQSRDVFSAKVGLAFLALKPCLMALPMNKNFDSSPLSENLMKVNRKLVVRLMNAGPHMPRCFGNQYLLEFTRQSRSVQASNSIIFHAHTKATISLRARVTTNIHITYRCFQHKDIVFVWNYRNSQPKICCRSPQPQPKLPKLLAYRNHRAGKMDSLRPKHVLAPLLPPFSAFVV